MNGARRLLAELGRRGIYRAAAYYAGAAWVALQVADVSFPGLGIHERAIRYVWLGVLVGFPLALMFAWRYDVTARGIVRTAAPDPSETDDRSLRVQDYILLAGLAIAAIGATYALIGQISQVGERAPLESPARAIDPLSIAVLPLENMSGPDQEYFAAGIHDALIADLSKVSALRVISRTSTIVYRDADKTLPEIGRELAVAKVIEGSVLRVKDQVRITIQLIDAATDHHLWAESYERDVADVLTLQRELARIIARQIAATITPEETQRLAAPRPVDPATYEAYLRGMFHLNQFTAEGITKGLAYLNDAVARDPADPLAYAGLALGYSLIGHSTGPRESFPRAKAAALKALERDPDLAEAHAALAEIRLYYDWDWNGAEASFRRALHLNPSLDFAHAHYAWYLQLVGRMDESFAEMKKARRLAPLSPLWSTWLAWLYWDAGRLDEAFEEIAIALELNPDFSWGWFVLGGLQAAEARFDEAIASHRKAAAVMPDLSWGLAQTYALAGRHDDARNIAAQVAKRGRPKDLLMLGAIHSALGDQDEALRWVEAAYEARVDWFPWIANPSLVGSLHGNPRFDQIVGRLDLPGEARR